MPRTDALHIARHLCDLLNIYDQAKSFADITGLRQSILDTCAALDRALAAEFPEYKPTSLGAKDAPY